jgi:hypothetical protein
MSARHSHKRQRPGNAARAADDARLKLHLRLVPIGRTLYRVVTLRPGTEAAFSTNYFHDTWHLLSDAHGAGLLARLLWGLSYQRQPGTLVALFGEHLRPTPFDADPSPPILLAPAHLTPLDHQNFRVLKSRLRRPSPPQQTVRWQTFGMDAGAGDLEEPFDVEMARHADLNRLWTTWPRAPHGPWQRERVSLCGGWVCYAAPPPVLRLQALVLRRMARANRSPMDYHYLAERRKADRLLRTLRLPARRGANLSGLPSAVEGRTGRPPRGACQDCAQRHGIIGPRVAGNASRARLGATRDGCRATAPRLLVTTPLRHGQ